MTYRRHDPAPTRVGTTAALAAATVAVAAIALSGGTLGLAGAVPGGIALLVGLRRHPGSRRAVGTGAILLFSGILLAGATGGRPTSLAVAAAAAAVGYDAAADAVARGEQLGPAAGGRVEAIRSAETAAVLGVAVGGTLLAGQFVAPGLPAAVLVALVAGAALVLVAVR